MNWEAFWTTLVWIGNFTLACWWIYSLLDYRDWEHPESHRQQLIWNIVGFIYFSIIIAYWLGMTL